MAESAPMRLIELGRALLSAAKTCTTLNPGDEAYEIDLMGTAMTIASKRGVPEVYAVNAISIAMG